MVRQPFQTFVSLPDSVPLDAFANLRKRVGHIKNPDRHDPCKIVGMAAVHGGDALGADDALRDRGECRDAHSILRTIPISSKSDSENAGKRSGPKNVIAWPSVSNTALSRPFSQCGFDPMQQRHVHQRTAVPVDGPAPIAFNGQQQVNFATFKPFKGARHPEE